MRKVAIPVAILALIGLDQWVKHWVVANISLNPFIVLWFLSYSIFDFSRFDFPGSNI